MSNSQTDSKALPFSGRVFLYTLREMDVITQGKLAAEYQAAGMSLEVRGFNYLYWKSATKGFADAPRSSPVPPRTPEKM